jgi:hypothetical protein
MKNNDIVVLESPARLLDAYERVLPTLSKMRKRSLLPVNVDPITAASTIRAALPNVKALLELIKNELPSFDPTLIEKLDQYTLALIHAQRRCICAKQPPERMKELIEQVRDIREQLQSDISCLAKRGLVKDYRRSALRASTSYRNLASDVLTLAELFRKNWAKVSRRSAVTVEELNQAEALANDLIVILGLRDRSPEVVADAALERQRIYTLCHTTYDQVRKVITFVRWEHGDANKLAPSLHGKRRKRRKSKTVSTQATPQNSTESSATAGMQPSTSLDAASTAHNDPFLN